MLESGVTASSADPIATIEGGRVVFAGGVRALDGVDVAIPAGAITALVGESGSGKTTLCRVLAGLQPLTAGRATVAGGPPSGRDLARRVQMLLQDAPGSLSPRMTVGALLAEPATIHGLDRGAAAARMALLLDRLGLGPGVVSRYPHQLSGGQARRVAAARALMLSPPFLVADEPTAGLDPSVQGELLNLLMGIQRGSIVQAGGPAGEQPELSVLVATHNLSVISRLATHLIVMYLGQVIEWGSAETILSRPSHPYTQALLSAHPSVDPALRRQRIVLRGDPPSVVDPPSGCRFHTRCLYAAAICSVEAPPWRSVSGSSARCHFDLREASRSAIGKC